MLQSPPQRSTRRQEPRSQSGGTRSNRSTRGLRWTGGEQFPCFDRVRNESGRELGELTETVEFFGHIFEVRLFVVHISVHDPFGHGLVAALRQRGGGGFDAQWYLLAAQSRGRVGSVGCVLPARDAGLHFALRLLHQRRFLERNYTRSTRSSHQPDLTGFLVLVFNSSQDAHRFAG